MSNENAVTSPAGYGDFLQEVKTQIRQRKAKTATVGCRNPLGQESGDNGLFIQQEGVMI